MQIVECGGAGGTGNQVAALCRGLSADARFEVSLVYAVRPGSTAAPDTGRLATVSQRMPSRSAATGRV